MPNDVDRAIKALERIALADERDRVDRILEIARDMLGMEIAYFSHFTTEEQVIERVSGRGASFGLESGTKVPVDDTYCRRMLDGEIPNIVPDARSQDALRTLEAASDGRVVAYVGVPLHLSSGRVYGTLCCAHHDTRDLDDQDLAFMRVLARLLADSIEHPPPLQEEWPAVDAPVARVDGSSELARLGFWVVATPRAVEASRRAFDSLAEWIPADSLPDVQVVISELVTNSVRHAGLDPSSAVGVQATVRPGVLSAHVSDPGTGFNPDDVPAPEPGVPGGWGLYLVGELTDRWGVVRPPSGGSRVWFEFSFG